MTRSARHADVLGHLQNENVTLSQLHPDDSPAVRKARGAFFTPPAIVDFITDWAIRDASDTVFEPSAGDAEFLVSAVRRLRELDPEATPTVHGVEIHEHSARVGRARVREAGGTPKITVSDFFLVEPGKAKYRAAIGNPPYVRYQDWSGEARVRSRAAALRAGVSLTGLASSWASFVVQSTLFLEDGGRLGLVLPAELLSVNYAAPVRRYLFEKFARVDVVLFDEQVFPEAEADVVLLLAEGFNQPGAKHATVHQKRNAEDLDDLTSGISWTPSDPAEKWTGAGLVSADATKPLAKLMLAGLFENLEQWGDTTLGAVTGNNHYFALSPAQVKEHNLHRHELVRISPPGSSHLRGLVLSEDMLTRLGKKGRETYLFYPGDKPSKDAQKYIDAGHTAGVDLAYKCRVRKTWWRVPLVAPADLLLTCMNADTPRLTTNEAGVRHLNSVHGVYLLEERRELGRELLPLASLNSITLLHAEMVGRAYGGGILKIEPREADRWAMPSQKLIADRAPQLREIRETVARKLQAGKLLEAVKLVDQVLLVEAEHLSAEELELVTAAHGDLSTRRTARGRHASI